MINGKFYTPQELADILGISLQRAYDIIRDNKIPVIKVRALIPAEEMFAYIWARWRRDLTRQMGVKVSGLVHHDEWDRNCPICGSFAIWKPATKDEITNLEMLVYDDGWPWLCVKGHSDKGEA